MDGFFYNLGKRMGPKVRKGKWLWLSMAGSEQEMVRAEYEVGRDLAEEIRNHTEPLDDSHICQLVSDIGSRLAARAKSKYRRFSFEILNASVPNAFALPGGFIFVTHAMLDLCGRDPDEMAFILAHEMGHVIGKHAIDRIVSSSAVNLISMGRPAAGALGGWLRKVGVEFLEGTYSHGNEFDADELGIRLIGAAGFDTNAPARLLTRLAELKRNDPEFPLGEYFSTHPPFHQRIARIRQWTS